MDNYRDSSYYKLHKGEMYDIFSNIIQRRFKYGEHEDVDIDKMDLFDMIEVFIDILTISYGTDKHFSLSKIMERIDDKNYPEPLASIYKNTLLKYFVEYNACLTGVCKKED